MAQKLFCVLCAFSLLHSLCMEALHASTQDQTPLHTKLAIGLLGINWRESLVLDETLYMDSCVFNMSTMHKVGMSKHAIVEWQHSTDTSILSLV